jgi:hypothetical protein
MIVAFHLHLFTHEQLEVAVRELRELASYHDQHWPLAASFLRVIATTCEGHPDLRTLEVDEGWFCPPDLAPAIRDRNYAFLYRIAEELRWRDGLAEPTRRILGALAIAIRESEAVRDRSWRSWWRLALRLGEPTVTSREGGPEDDS